MGAMLRGHGGLLKMPIVFITQVLVRAAIPDKSRDEPNEQQQGYHDGHDHVTDLIAQVHEYGHDVVGLGQGEDADHPLEHQHQQFTGIFTLVDVVDSQTDQQFNHGNDRQEDRRVANTLLERFIINVVMYGYFFKSGMLHIELVQSLEFRV